jgi:hypothetical protein
MSTRYLGDQLDIHGGGLDLQFPHHENELAQSESLHGCPMATFWMHNGLMQAGSAAGKVGGRPRACSSVCPQSPRPLRHTGGQQLERHGPRRPRHHWGRTSGSCVVGSVRGGGRQVGRHHHHSTGGGSCSGGARDGARHPRRGGRRGKGLGDQVAGLGRQINDRLAGITARETLARGGVHGIELNEERIRVVYHKSTWAHCKVMILRFQIIHVGIGAWVGEFPDFLNCNGILSLLFRCHCKSENCRLIYTIGQ